MCVLPLSAITCVLLGQDSITPRKMEVSFTVNSGPRKKANINFCKYLSVELHITLVFSGPSKGQRLRELQSQIINLFSQAHHFDLFLRTLPERSWHLHIIYCKPLLLQALSSPPSIILKPALSVHTKCILHL